MGSAVKKKHLSLLLCLLFLFGQTAVTRVLCFSPQQGKNLEFAFFGFQCDCGTETCSTHSHEEGSGEKPPAVFDPACNFCFDIPFSDVFTPGRFDAPTVTDDSHGNYSAAEVPVECPSRPRYSHYRSFPVSKFLHPDSPVSRKTLIRC